MENNQLCTLHSENLTGLGAPMGMERTTTNYRKNFKDVQIAKDFAEKEYGKPIDWEVHEKGLTSGDLSYVMYTIEILEFEDEDILKPVMLPDSEINLEAIKKIGQEYMDFVYSDNYHEDNDFDHYFFETAMTSLFGKDVFKTLNKKTP